MPRTKHETPQKTRQRRPYPNRSFNPEIKRGLGVIILFLIAGLLLLSYFGAAGQAGGILDNLLAMAFGQSRLLLPGLLLLVGVLIEMQRDYPHDSRHLLGFLLLLFGINGLIHLSLPLAQSLKIALTGQAGGLLGFGASYPLKYLFGFWAPVAILSALILASFLLLFNTSLAHLLITQKKLLMKLGTLGKIIIGVISLFIKKTPTVMSYGPNGSLSEEPIFDFQSRAIKNTNEEMEKPLPSSQENPSPKSEDDFLKISPAKKTNAKLPPLDIFSNVRSLPTSGDIKGNLYTIQKTLENFGLNVEMGEVRVGPTVTQYTLKPADGVKLSRLTALHNDLALALAAHPIRIEAPIPGKALVGVEVPNQKVALVSLREILESMGWREKKNGLPVALGKDVSGKPWVTDLHALPHLLIAGATGSGKTVCINTLISSLLFQHTPQTLRLILVDPKRVELPLYNGIPHLLTPVITDVAKTVNALKWTIGEMERRFDLLSKSSRRDIIAYNKVMDEPLPFIVFIIDELADLMVAAGAEVEAGIIRLAQMARAVGIHLVLATQRPSVDIITGLIKANFSARIAFSVASLMDSRTILDTGGAEKLLGRGDMLWSPPDMSKPKRLQGAFVSDEEIKRLVDFLKSEEPPQYNDEIVTKQQSAISFDSMSRYSEDSDPLLEEAKETIAQAGKASASLLQRRLKVGYARAARLLDLLEEMGFIGPSDGAKPREILLPLQKTTIIENEENLLDESEIDNRPADQTTGQEEQ